MLAFFKGKSFISKLIKWRTWGQYSHVAWVERDGTIWESWHIKDPITKRTGPRKGYIGDLHTDGTDVDLFVVELSSIEHRALLNELDQPIKDGVKYDFRGIFGGFLLRQPQSETDDKMFCSDYMMTAFNNIGKPLLSEVNTWKVSPEELAHSPLIKKIGSYKTGTQFHIDFL